MGKAHAQTLAEASAREEMGILQRIEQYIQLEAPHRAVKQQAQGLKAKAYADRCRAMKPLLTEEEKKLKMKEHSKACRQKKQEAAKTTAETPSAKPSAPAQGPPKAKAVAGGSRAKGGAIQSEEEKKLKMKEHSKACRQQKQEAANNATEVRAPSAKPSAPPQKPPKAKAKAGGNRGKSAIENEEEKKLKMKEHSKACRQQKQEAATIAAQAPVASANTSAPAQRPPRAKALAGGSNAKNAIQSEEEKKLKMKEHSKACRKKAETAGKIAPQVPQVAPFQSAGPKVGANVASKTATAAQPRRR